jgi:hypothetical protein
MSISNAVEALKVVLAWLEKLDGLGRIVASPALTGARKNLAATARNIVSKMSAHRSAAI